MAFGVGIALVAMSALSCSSTSELEAISTQIRDVQQQLLQLQKSSPSQDDVAELGSRVENQIDAIQVGQADLAASVDQLALRVEQLQNKLEDTNFQLAKLSQQISATQVELQAVRLAAEEAQRAAPPSPPVEEPGDPQALYDTAYNDYVAGNFDLAILGFRQYLETFPDTEQSDNAAYWLGECYYRQSRFQKAIDQFDLVLDQYETSDRAASALLKKGYAYLELNERAPGVVQLQKVICDHAGTDEAVLARNRLRELSIDVEC